MTEGDKTMGEQMDRATMDLIAENAAIRAIAKHEEHNINRLHWFEQDLKAYVDKSIETHSAVCPIGAEFKTCKAKLIGIAIGIATGSSGITVGLTKLLGLLSR